MLCVVFSIQAANVFVCFEFKLSARRSHTGSLFTNNEEQKQLARDITDAFATHDDLVHGVTDTDCHTQNEGTKGCGFVIFKETRLLIDFKTAVSIVFCCCFYFFLGSDTPVSIY